ncbi:MAG: flavodoxin family protein [Methanotrichaceae archaeon]
MKAIGIVGSPRKNGNVDTLVQAVLDGASESGYQTKKFYLNEMSYSGCQGCSSCKVNDRCRLDDDVSELLTEMKEADAVVFGSPIYVYQFAGQFKLMEDRMFSLIDKDFKSRLMPGKKAVIVTSQGDPNPSTFDNVTQEFAKSLNLLGFKVVDTIKMVSGGNPNAAKGRKDLLEKAKAAGRSL